MAYPSILSEKLVYYYNGISELPIYMVDYKLFDFFQKALAKISGSEDMTVKMIRHRDESKTYYEETFNVLISTNLFINTAYYKDLVTAVMFHRLIECFFKRTEGYKEKTEEILSKHTDFNKYVILALKYQHDFSKYNFVFYEEVATELVEHELDSKYFLNLICALEACKVLRGRTAEKDRLCFINSGLQSIRNCFNEALENIYE